MVQSAQHFRDGLHYCEVLVHYKSVYCGIGVLNEQTTLPSAGTGAWLGTGGIMWVANRSERENHLLEQLFNLILFKQVIEHQVFFCFELKVLFF